MIDTLRSEWIKLRTVRMNVVLFIIAVALPLIVSVLTAALQNPADIDAQGLVELVSGTSVVTALLLGVVGTASISGEFAHGTIRPTFAATPKRVRVLAMKAIVIAVFAAVAEALVVVLCYGISSAVATSRNAVITLDDAPQGKAALLGVVIFAIIVSLLGFGLGMLIRNMPAAIAVLFVWPLIAEQLLAGLLYVAGVDDPVRYMPYISGFQLGNPQIGSDDPVSRVGGGLYFFAVTAVVAVVGGWFTNRRDA